MHILSYFRFNNWEKAFPNADAPFYPIWLYCSMIISNIDRLVKVEILFPNYMAPRVLIILLDLISIDNLFKLDKHAIPYVIFENMLGGSLL